MGDDIEAAFALATSAALGLLVGLERERNPLTKAGVRTFSLVAVLGTLATLLARELDSGWIVAAALVVFTLGAHIALGHRQIAVVVGVAMTALRYVAWRLTLGRHGLLVTGFLGGLVSSTATTLVAACNARSDTQTPAAVLAPALLLALLVLVH